MRVSFKVMRLTTTEYVTLTNVIWVRVTEKKVLIECQDGRRFNYCLKLLLDFEVIHA